MKFQNPVKPVESLFDDYLAYIANPPLKDSQEYKRQKVIFFSSITLFVGYLKIRFPHVPKMPTKAQKDKATADLQEIYNASEGILKKMSENETMGTDLGTGPV